PTLSFMLRCHSPPLLTSFPYTTLFRSLRACPIVLFLEQDIPAPCQQLFSGVTIFEFGSNEGPSHFLAQLYLLVFQLHCFPSQFYPHLLNSIIGQFLNMKPVSDQSGFCKGLADYLFHAGSH